MCGKRLTFLYTSPYAHVEYNVCSEIVIFTIIFVVESLKGFGWNNVGPASQTVAQHYIMQHALHRGTVVPRGTV